MAGIKYKFKKHMETFGPFYIRVLLGSILLMSIGMLLFFVGFYLVGNRVVVMGGSSEAYNVYVYVTGDRGTALLAGGGRIQIFSVTMEKKGIVVVNIATNPPRLPITFVVKDSVSGREVYRYQPAPGAESSASLRVELDPGRYDFYVSAPQGLGGQVVADYKIYYVTENPNYVISQWLQVLGLILSGIGLLTLVLSYEIARREAEAEYMVPPKAFREMIAEQSYLRLSTRTANIRDEEIVFHEEYGEEEEE